MNRDSDGPSCPYRDPDCQRPRRAPRQPISGARTRRLDHQGHPPGRDDPDPGRDQAPHRDLHPEWPARADAVHPEPVTLRGAVRPRRQGIPRLAVRLQGIDRRRLHRRPPGHPREIPLGRHLRDAPPAPELQGPEGHRREHRRLRHDRVAPQERPEQQRQGRDDGRVVHGLDHGHGHARPAPCAQGRLPPSLAGRHVPGRRLPPQRRLPAELRHGIRLRDGAGRRGKAIRLRDARHLSVVPRSGPADQRRGKVRRVEAADLGRFRRPPELRRLLETAGLRALPDPGHGAHAQRGGLVGPGGFLRAAPDLRIARAPRRPQSELPGRRPVEPRRLGRRQG